jgi:exopolysaccharide biosynthesis polyprenyl glycosylphosphotransferase
MVQQQSRSQILPVIDSVTALAVAVVVTLYANHELGKIPSALTKINFIDAAFGLFFVGCWQYCLTVMCLYDRFAVLPSKMTTILKAVVVMQVPLILHFMLFHQHLLNFRTVSLVAVALFCFEVDRVLVVERIVDRLAARDPRQVIILGSGRRASKAWKEIRTRYHSSVNLLGFVDNRNISEMAPDVASRYLGTVDQLDDLLLKKTVDTVLVAMPIKSCYPLMQQAVSIAERVGCDVVYLHDIYSTRKKPLQTQSVFHELVPLHEHYLLQQAVKRLLDVVLSVVGLVLLSPLLLCIAIAVKISSHGPILFVQERYGFRRRRFRMLKFRTMVRDAEKMMERLEIHNEASGPIFKMRNDPRVTRVGRLLRSTSLDELPQLWNVLIGDMSLVGPRPMSVRDVSLFNEATLMRRFSVKPGMTGLWQVTGRSEVGFEQWIELDFNYIDRWSLLLDAQIMFRTVSVVMKRSGAM